MMELFKDTEAKTTEGLGAPALNVWLLPVPMMLLPDQLREARAFLGSIQYTPALDAAAATAASTSWGRQWNSRMWECR
jgi:hypothetical protein